MDRNITGGRHTDGGAPRPGEPATGFHAVAERIGAPPGGPRQRNSVRFTSGGREMRRYVVGAAVAAALLLQACSTQESRDAAADATLAAFELPPGEIPFSQLVAGGFGLGADAPLVAGADGGWVLIDSWRRDDGAPDAVALTPDGMVAILPEPPSTDDASVLVPVGDSVALVNRSCESCDEESVAVHLLHLREGKWRTTEKETPLGVPSGEDVEAVVLGYGGGYAVVSFAGVLLGIDPRGDLSILERPDDDGSGAQLYCVARTTPMLFSIDFELSDEAVRASGTLDPDDLLGEVSYSDPAVAALNLDLPDDSWKGLQAPPRTGGSPFAHVACGTSGPVIAGEGATAVFGGSSWKAVQSGLPAPGMGSPFLTSDVSNTGVLAVISAGASDLLAYSPARESWSVRPGGWLGLVASGEHFLMLSGDERFEIVSAGALES